MAQAPTLPSITIPSAEYSVETSWEVKNSKLEGDGVKVTFLYENWPAVPLLFTLVGELSTATGQPVYKPWFETPFSGTPDSRHPTFKVKTAGWPGENDGSGGRKPIKGDFRFKVRPTQAFTTTITAEMF